MKRVKIFLLLFTLCCALTACGTKPADDTPPPDDEAPAVDVDWFNTEFFNVGSGVCMTNMLLSSYYDTAADIDLYELFYNGMDEQETITDEERAALVEICQWATEVGVSKVSAARMDAFLQEYLGVTLDETNKKNLDQFFYIEEYDAYYNAHGDTNFQRCTVLSGERDEDGVITLTYEQEGGKKGIVTLKESGDGYRFMSNREA